jgi:hypothetical protein
MASVSATTRLALAAFARTLRARRRILAWAIRPLIDTWFRPSWPGLSRLVVWLAQYQPSACSWAHAPHGVP